ncbi:cell envelope integrity protein TolA [Xanthomonas arboricola pv. juglandis]|uniref:Cell envelope integrity protein TolA n=1 Tax=Xanthomonas euroxanthea TaxID=2259622 RepID=A0A6V7N5L1_9XANT|nr:MULTISPECIES: cell envelope integrity protein TolA [Xanthomonas]PPT28594.1 protein TolA [Xanthomonas arboricola]SYZ50319.1 cell envelope integrity protein TolA [Xanthomonas arboricola pv. juglandis]MBB3778420.1 colicin import membrane protein [Xanthomonas euroxanthea]MBB3814202.1 colicin import membrane protein [Xanthomonas euroxanthea]MBB5768452.1 colicin import membrane protein [Xanthomonas euroxanthea]
MHADALPTQTAREDGWLRPVMLALVVHVLVALVFIAGWLWSPERSVEPAAGDPSMEASLDVSAAEARVARQALKATPVEAPPPPAPLPEPAPEDTVPPPQPIPEPRPQDAPTPQQAQAQERVAQPDKVDQDRVDALALSAEKAKQEQEAKRRQEQIDLTERKRQEEAEQKLRLAKQQEEADAKKKQAAAQQAAADAEREKKIAEIRRQREQATKEAALAEQKLRQVAAARAQQASSAAAASAQPTAGQGGTSTDLSAKYAAAIQQKVLAQWVRPPSVPPGQKCTINIRQLPGGSVMEAKVAPGCPYDEAGQRSIEAAVLSAQPLPYRGFESVFQRNLTFVFTAQDQ